MGYNRLKTKRECIQILRSEHKSCSQWEISSGIVSCCISACIFREAMKQDDGITLQGDDLTISL